MFIDRSQYAQGYLKMLQDITGVDNWFDFLDREDRMDFLLSIVKPLSLTDDETMFDWIMLKLLVQDNFYGLWPNATEYELEIAEEYRQRASRFLEYGGEDF
jgi:hypothetical protein